MQQSSKTFKGQVILATDRTRHSISISSYYDLLCIISNQTFSYATCIYCQWRNSATTSGIKDRMVGYYMMSKFHDIQHMHSATLTQIMSTGNTDEHTNRQAILSCDKINKKIKL